ncbi:ABC transporter permease [Terracidiphilus gabretensis]|uniref:ABC transporter permease n=1 Tax=Terracidiphilus gabretensis TaxID=1577687 RepID=UPI00071B24C7|nr:ABC transporter permease [Terracidiphilus gabretensis]
MQKLLFDLRFVLRQLAKSPGFTITAVLMLAFGIGATTAIFSVVEAVMLRPLPFPDSKQLMVLSDQLAGVNVGGNGGVGVTVPDIRAYTRETHGFSALGGYQGAGYELSGTGEPAQVNASRLTAGIFSALGVNPLMGRVFTADEDEHSQQVVVLSYAAWVSRFHRDAQILGTKILLDRKPYVVIGVMPRNFEFPLNPGQLNRSELWVPMSFRVDELTPTAGANWSYQMVGRLKPGVSAQQAESDAETVAQETMRNYPPMMANLHISAVVRPLQLNTTEQAGPLLRTLFLAVAVVLLIACVNLAGLMLVRAIRQQREVALRLALGASTSVLLRQAILESLVLSVSGGVLGLALAAVALRVGKSMLPESLPRISEIGLNWNVVGFALVVGVVTGLVCGLAPAFAAMRTNMNANLKEGGRAGSEGGGHARLRSTLVVAEIAIALVLLAASFLLLRSFDKMRSVDLGYKPDHVTTASYSLPQKQYEKQSQIDEFNRELLRRLNALPGVTATGFTSLLPSEGNNNNQTFVVEGYTPPKGAALNLATTTQTIGNFFPAMGIPLLRGRFFTDSDRHGAQLVLIVNHGLAQHFWPGQDSIGKHLRIGTQEMQTPWMTVVGEVADVKLASPDQPANMQYYTPVDQIEDDIGSLGNPATDTNGNGGFIVLRSSLPPEQMENSLRSAVRSIDPLLPLTQVQTMEQAVSVSEAPRRFNTVLIGSFAFAAVLLAVLGIYSVISFSVASRVQEMAIRMALGSQRGSIVRLVLSSGAKLAVIGCVIGLAGAVAASKLLQSLLFGISPFDPLALSVAAVGVLLLALAASALPALRAASIDPMRALRGE